MNKMKNSIKLNKVQFPFLRKGSKGKPGLVTVALFATSSDCNKKSPTGTGREIPKNRQVLL